mmetsp:Transcript_210/g.907  ORF Transcript_210/g.907 Transcript_210/m.907 type:complete len:265 (-) Transcript_210:985-1779(-)
MHRDRMHVWIDGRDGREEHGVADVPRDGRDAPASGSRRPRVFGPYRRRDDAVQIRGRRRQVPKPPPSSGTKIGARSARSARSTPIHPGRNLGRNPGRNPGPKPALLLRAPPGQKPGQKRPRHVLHGSHDFVTRAAPVVARRVKVRLASRAEASLGVRDDPRRERFRSRRRPQVRLVAVVARTIQILALQILALQIRQLCRRRPPPGRRQHALHLREHGRLGVHLDQRPGTRHQRPVDALAGDVPIEPIDRTHVSIVAPWLFPRR